MQTPISFALDILLDCDTIEKAHKAARKYIKELEKTPTMKPMVSMTANPAYANGGAALIPAQAPSTQRLLEQHAPLMAAPVKIPAAEIDKETGRAMVNTGNGTKGARKW